MTDTLVIAPGDAAHKVAQDAYVARDADLINALAEANPEHPWIQIEAAHLAVDLRQPKAALHYLGAAGKASPDTTLRSWFYWHITASALAQLGDQGEGEAASTMAVRLAPKQALLWVTHATYAFHRGDVQEGHARLLHALECPIRDPEDEKAVGESLLYLGRYKDGWKHWEARTKLRSVVGRHVFHCPLWRGENLRKKRIVVWGEQGAGDQIQFLRFVPLLKMRGAEIVLRIMPGLIPWASELFESGTVAELAGEGDISGTPDYHVPLLSLPHWLGRPNPKDWPAPWAPDAPLSPVAGRVGYCWRGNPEHGNDHDRSHPERAEFLWQLGATDQWVNLTGGDEDGPKGTWRETADLVASCQAVVTVDTGIAHVAGSLGVPTVLIAGSAPEWRWGNRTDTTPWYPSMRIVRKRYVGDWTDVMVRAVETLGGMTT